MSKLSKQLKLTEIDGVPLLLGDFVQFVELEQGNLPLGNIRAGNLVRKYLNDLSQKVGIERTKKRIAKGTCTQKTLEEEITDVLNDKIIDEELLLALEKFDKISKKI